MFQILVNGESRTVAAGDTLLDVIRSLNLDPERVAVELDRTIIKKVQWAATSVPNGAKVEIVQFVGGG